MITLIAGKDFAAPPIIVGKFAFLPQLVA